MTPSVLVLLAGCALLPSPRPAQHKLVVRGVDVASVDRALEGPTTTWTTTWHFVDGDRTAVRTTTRAGDGTLAAWTGPVGPRAHVEVTATADGLAWRDGDVAGTLPVPGGAVIDPMAGGPALVGWPEGATRWIWTGYGVAEATRSPAPRSDAIRLDTPRGAWTVSVVGGGVTDARWPDGTELRTGAVQGTPVDPVELLRLDAEPLAQARSARRLVLRWSDRPDPIVRERPLDLELPRLPVRDPEPPPRDPRRIPTAPPPEDLALPEATDRIALVDAALAVVRERFGPGDDAGACLAMARTLVAGLRFEGVVAEVVNGWLYVDAPRPSWVRHAWVRVRLDDPVPWWEVDPGLGQRIADAAHLPDDPPRPLPEGVHLEVLEVR